MDIEIVHHALSSWQGEPDVEPVEHPDGEWVKYQAIEQLRAELVQVVEEMRAWRWPRDGQTVLVIDLWADRLAAIAQPEPEKGT